MTIVDLPSFKPDAKRHGGREGSDTMVAIDFTRKIVLICGSSYAGEMKKSVFTEYAWHSLFIRQLLIRPVASELADFVPEMTIIDMPSFRADPKRHGCKSENVVAIDFARKIVLIGGSYYAGEMKKSVFTTLNYYLPAKGVMPMHCSANVGPDGDTAIFFGLSGTGKTTLSADPNRTLIGDDEHEAWPSSGAESHGSH